MRLTPVNRLAAARHPEDLERCAVLACELGTL
eukprot:COSAG05_NODE_23972_length_254_cov_1.225806_1_plen_31_part_10